ncbi:protein INVOLVED IN DE NOVO 2 [Sesamum alatum]|uniref:Protein INVOLVED IN DE NOVO 2 n=1 Tax=Sesamum alatum TaxID=300844 RepID=A0AAE2CUD9_9LAMI|nr:protein INVOLVED IN DE NOVO 2 [Sesamum alatum]
MLLQTKIGMTFSDLKEQTRFSKMARKSSHKSLSEEREIAMRSRHMGSSLEHSSGEDNDISDSETEDYQEKAYEELKSGKHQHASAIGSCSSHKRTARDRANHLALAKYFENGIAVDAGLSKPSAEVDALADQDRDEMFVWA